MLTPAVHGWLVLPVIFPPAENEVWLAPNDLLVDAHACGFERVAEEACVGTGRVPTEPRGICLGRELGSESKCRTQQFGQLLDQVTSERAPTTFFLIHARIDNRRVVDAVGRIGHYQ